MIFYSPLLTLVSLITLLLSLIVTMLIVLKIMNVYRSPAVALMPDVTPKPLRSKGNAIINLMGAAGGIIALIYMTFTNSDYNSYTLTFIILSVLMIVFLLIFLFNVKENKLVEERIEEEKKAKSSSKSSKSSNRIYNSINKWNRINIK